MKKKSAFTLLELSIVILIIGVLAVGVMQGKSIATKAKVSTAQNQTAQSPVASTDNIVAWWETTSERSFIDSEASNNSSLSTWYDINPKALSALNLTQSTSNLQPTYKTKIENGLPMVKFSASQLLNISDSTIPYENSNYTIFIVAKMGTCSSSCYIVHSGNDGALGNNVIDHTATVIRQNWNGSTLDSTASLSQTHIYSFTYSNASGRINYVDGTQISSDSSTNRASARTYNYIGGGNFDGYVGEIIVFDRNLKTEERKSIEKYLSRKWGIGVS